MRASTIVILLVLLATATFAQPLKLISAQVYSDEYAAYLQALEKALAGSSILFHHQTLPDQRFNVVLERGIFDIASLLPASQIAGTDYIRVEPEITYANLYMFYNADLALDDLQGKTMAIVSGTRYRIPTEQTYQLNRILVGTNADALKMVNAGRADMVFLSNSANSIISMLNLKNIIQAPKPVVGEGFYLALHPSQAALADPLHELITDIKSEGTFAYQDSDGSVFRPSAQ